MNSVAKLNTDPNMPRVVWTPLPGSQTLALSCPAQIILYHGTRGPGKTDAQLMRFRMRVGQGYGRHWRGIIFDREYKNLDDLVSKSMRWFPEFGDKAKFLSSKADYRWVWPTGEELLFRAVRKESDYWGYHGQEFPFIGWNELTKYSNDNLFEMMMSCNRSSFIPEENRIYDQETETWYTPPEMPLEVFATCNPYGPGHNWVRRRFINAAPAGRIKKTTVRVFNPRTRQEEDVVKTQVHLFGSYRENKYLSPEYVAGLVSIQDPNKRKAWLGGSWDVMAGGMFDDLWSSEHHILEPFAIPPSWKIDRAYDHGSSKPFSVGWYAQSDGTDYYDAKGNRVSTVKGDLFRIGEWYGWNGKSNTGLRLTSGKIAEGIVQRELQMKIYDRVVPGPADSAIWDETPDAPSVAKEMSKPVRFEGKVYRGVHWVPANKSSGSRKLGWEECRTMLENAKLETYKLPSGEVVVEPRERPGLFVFNTCPMFIELFPSLPRDEDDMDDVDTDAEDHIGDEVRYRVLQISHAMTTNMRAVS